MGWGKRWKMAGMALNGTPRESKRFTFTTHRFYEKSDPLSESGLIGPVLIKISN